MLYPKKVVVRGEVFHKGWVVLGFKLGVKKIWTLI